ncbi:hypothetical protein [Methylogaea oryzae]|uniref:Mor transcription activator domain-containing protein n=1 Tax=Methylogaea oryzae TaxID=1295382 RepID=A0A8D4VND9_9GAMM|nr:hypothetical protein [Methylogaea oryzae]BBL69732.1 hypothetical protein MoryE10_03380 [Methylogaea oryzae]
MSALPDGFNEYRLPESIRRIAEYCGMDVALKIMAEYGGVHLCVPVKARPEHRLVELLGPVDAARFCEAFGNQTLNIPKGQALQHALRLNRMMEMRAAKATMADIARAVGLTERRVTDLMGGAPSINRQQDRLEGF